MESGSASLALAPPSLTVRLLVYAQEGWLDARLERDVSGDPRQVNDKRGITTVGKKTKEFTTAELDAAVRRVLAPYTLNGRPNEWAIATAFARKVRAAIGPLVDVIRRSILPS